MSHTGMEPRLCATSNLSRHSSVTEANPLGHARIDKLCSDPIYSEFLLSPLNIVCSYAD
jgi:hypothetical protein